MNSIEAIQFSSKMPVFQFDRVRNDWCDTRHMQVLWESASLVAPEAEKYIMRSVLAYRDHPVIKNSEWLKTLIDEFITQEREHTRIHIELNKALGMQHICENAKLGDTMRNLTANLSVLDNLAVAAALEHLFFSVIKLTFIDTGFYKDKTVDPNVLNIFTWHWCEELEHHSVTLSLLSELDKNYKTRFYAAYNMLFKLIPACYEIVLEVERFHSPKHYIRNSIVDIIKLLNYFRKGIGVSSKFLMPKYDIIKAGEWSWPYIEEMRKTIGFEESVQIQSNKT